MKETWKVGNHPSTVVSDSKQTNTNFPSPPNNRESDDDEVEFYGGYLVCESVGNVKQAKLIAAAPKLLHALTELLPIAENWINANHPLHKQALSAIKDATE